MPDESPRPAYHYGDIVLVADFLDPNGVNPKDRPCVVVTDPKVSSVGGPYRVVAISTLVPDPLPPGYVLLPYYHPRHPVTGLNRKAAAICPWLDVIEEDRIIRRLGVVPNPRLLEIAAELDRISPEEGQENQ
jgi:mRNA-degrading endonuclease toxin of MazEF toxin-antitoxin module